MLASGVEIASLLYRAYVRLVRRQQERGGVAVGGQPAAQSSIVPAIVRLGSTVNTMMSTTAQDVRSGVWEQRVSANARFMRRVDFAELLLYWIPFAEAASAATAAEAVRTCGHGLGPEDVLHFKPSASHLEPGFLVTRDKSRNAIVCIVRSTQSIADVMTDLTVETEPFLGDYGHRGIIAAAVQLADHSVIPEIMRKFVRDGTEFVVVGHSLGAAVGMALAMYLKTKTSVPQKISCIAFCPPPFVGRRLALRNADPSLISVVNGFDLVSRLSVASLERLIAELEDRQNQASVYRSMLEPYVGRDIAVGIESSLPSFWSLVGYAAQPTRTESATRGASWTTLESLGSAIQAASYALNVPSGLAAGADRQTPLATNAAGLNSSRELRIPGQLYHVYRSGPNAPVRILADISCDAFADLEISQEMLSDHFTSVLRNSLENFIATAASHRHEEQLIVD